jgi:N-acetylglucosamine kinase-like BadF-type ATPase
LKNHRGYVLGIDGGGTKTLGILADLEGKVLSTALRRASNPQIEGFRSAARIVLDVVRECCSKAKCTPKQLRCIVVGLAGAGREGDRRRVLKEIRAEARRKKFPLKYLLVESDVRFALEGALAGKSGLLLISGTGSIAMAKDSRGDILRVGGWGRAIGDEGSGYSIGRRALAAVAKYIDGRGEPTMLTRLVARKFGFRNSQAIITKVYQKNFDLAQIAPVVLYAADKGDRVSKRIVENAVDELADHVKTLLKKILNRPPRRTTRFPIVLMGGLLSRQNYLVRLLNKRLKALSPRIRIQRPRFLPAYGAVLMGLQTSRGMGTVLANK